MIKKIKIMLVLLAFFLVSCSEKLAPIDNNGIIVAFGDSLTFGMGTTIDKSYPMQLQQIINYEVVNAGLNGDTAKNGKKRIEQVVEQYQPDLVILSLGANDMIRRDNPNLKDDMEYIIQYLNAKHVRVVLLAEPQPSILGLTTGLKDAKLYKDLAQQYNLLLISDVFSHYLSKNELKSDPIHLNEKGYRLAAENIANQLQKSGIIIKKD